MNTALAFKNAKFKLIKETAEYHLERCKEILDTCLHDESTGKERSFWHYSPEDETKAAADQILWNAIVKDIQEAS